MNAGIIVQSVFQKHLDSQACLTALSVSHQVGTYWLLDTTTQTQNNEN